MPRKKKIRRKKTRGSFRPLTPAQKRCYAAVRALRVVVVTPADARPLKALQRRGLVRYRRVDGVRVAVLRDSKAVKRSRRRAAAGWEKVFDIFKVTGGES